MPLEDMNKKINKAFEKLKITSEDNEDTIIEQGDYSHFTPLILSVINDVRKKKKHPDNSSIYDYIMKTQASNADEHCTKNVSFPLRKSLMENFIFCADIVLIESVIVKPILEGKIVNKKTPQGLDSFYNSTNEIDNIQYNHSQTQLQGTNLSDINSSFLSETASSIDKNLQTPIRKSSFTISEERNNQNNNENPSDNPTFKENTPVFIQIWTPLSLKPKVKICYTF